MDNGIFLVSGNEVTVLNGIMTVNGKRASREACIMKD